MDTLKIAYWIFEYALVMAGYLLLFFVWPHIVFASHLSGKSPIYRMGFCFSVQTVLISSLVLLLGFLHILNPWTMRIILYGVPVAVLLRKFSKMEIDSASFFHIVLISRAKVLVKRFQTAYAAKFREMWKTSIRPYIWEYLVLALLLIYNLIYLSWGPFQTKCYSLPDQYVHHSWLYGLTQGQIFSGGVYPSAMHCLLYAIHCLLGVKTRMLILFFGSIQGVAILLAFYCLMRELFRWRWVPLLALTMISLCGNGTELGLKSMVRLQGTLPLEFAMMFQFFCVLFLLRYLKSSQKPCGRGKLSGLILGNDLLVFTMCVAATVSVHFHPAVTTVFMCLGIAPFYFRRVFSRERLLPLVAAVLAGVLAALLPMAIAWASGIPLNGSFGWGLKVIQNLEEDEGDKGDEEFQLQIEQEPDSDAETNIISKVVNTAAFVVQMIYLGHLSLARGHQYKAYVIVMFGAMGVSLLMKWLLARRPRLLERLKQYGISQISFDGYVTLAILSIAVVLLGISSDLGLPSLTTTDRIFVTERMLLLAAVWIPLDFLFSLAASFGIFRLLQVLSAASLAVLCFWCTSRENYHGYLFCGLTRYPVEISVMDKIIDSYPQFQYTIVSPTDGLYHVNEYGRHEELLTFVQKSAGGRYFLPTRYVFVFVEKKPLRYDQNYFFAGPSWLALEKYTLAGSRQAPDVWASEISAQAAQKEIPQFSLPFDNYRYLENRTVVESKAYYWCQRFAELYPHEMSVYYEDDDFVCYYFEQEPHSPYNLAIDYERLYEEE